MIIVGAYPNFVQGHEPQVSRIAALNNLLTGWLPPGVAIHLLPFYPSCGDGGFASTSWMDVDPALGSWSDVETLAARRYLIVDVIFNHVGVEHPLFKQFLENPEANSELFHAYPQAPSLESPLSPRGVPVLREWNILGKPWLLWQTFTDVAVDLRIDHPEIMKMIERQLSFLAQHSIRAVRLDAPAYFGKRPGGPVRYNIESYRIARLVEKQVRIAGLEMIAQLDCDAAAREYFPSNQGYAVPLIDFSFAAQLALAILSADVRLLADHLRATWCLGTPLLRAPRTHDGILLKAEDFQTHGLALLQRAGAFGIKPRVIGGRPYEFNASLPHLYAAGAQTPTDRDARLHLAVLTATFAPGIPYLYLPALLGYEPELFFEKEDDPRSLNRRPLVEKVTGIITASPHAQSMAALIGQLAALELPPEAPAANNSVHCVGTSGLFVERRERQVAMLANFSNQVALTIPTELAGRSILSRGLEGNCLEPLGFVILRVNGDFPMHPNPIFRKLTP